MSDDFIDDEFIEEEERTSSNGPFLMTVGALFLVFIFAGACTLFFLLQDGTGVTNDVANANGEQIAARETENALRIATNTAVAIAVAGTETAQAQPTTPPTLPPTATTPPTETPVPTNTPVVKEELDSGLDDGEAAADAGTDAESDAEDSGVTEDSGTESVAAASEVTPIPAAGAEALPQTGFNTGPLLAIGLLLVLVLFAARRLRTNS